MAAFLENLPHDIKTLITNHRDVKFCLSGTCRTYMKQYLKHRILYLEAYFDYILYEVFNRIADAEISYYENLVFDLYFNEQAYTLSFTLKTNNRFICKSVLNKYYKLPVIERSITKLLFYGFLIIADRKQISVYNKTVGNILRFEAKNISIKNALDDFIKEKVIKASTLYL